MYFAIHWAGLVDVQSMKPKPATYDTMCFVKNEVGTFCWWPACVAPRRIGSNNSAAIWASTRLDKNELGWQQPLPARPSQRAAVEQPAVACPAAHPASQSLVSLVCPRRCTPWAWAWPSASPACCCRRARRWAAVLSACFACAGLNRSCHCVPVAVGGREGERPYSPAW